MQAIPKGDVGSDAFYLAIAVVLDVWVIHEKCGIANLLHLAAAKDGAHR